MQRPVRCGDIALAFLQKARPKRVEKAQRVVNGLADAVFRDQSAAAIRHTRRVVVAADPVGAHPNAQLVRDVPDFIEKMEQVRAARAAVVDIVAVGERKVALRHIQLAFGKPAFVEQMAQVQDLLRRPVLIGDALGVEMPVRFGLGVGEGEHGNEIRQAVRPLARFQPVKQQVAVGVRNRAEAANLGPRQRVAQRIGTVSIDCRQIFWPRAEAQPAGAHVERELILPLRGFLTAVPLDNVRQECGEQGFPAFERFIQQVSFLIIDHFPVRADGAVRPQPKIEERL